MPAPAQRKRRPIVFAPGERERWESLGRAEAGLDTVSPLYSFGASCTDSPSPSDFVPVDRVAIVLDSLRKVGGAAADDVLDIYFQLRGGTPAAMEILAEVRFMPASWADSGLIFQVSGVSFPCWELWGLVADSFSVSVGVECSVVLGRGVGGGKFEVVKGERVYG
jgi:hypothetical protein